MCESRRRWWLAAAAVVVLSVLAAGWFWAGRGLLAWDNVKLLLTPMPDVANLPKDELLSDFDYLSEILMTSHPYLELKQEQFGFDWQAHVGQFRQQVETAHTSREFCTAIQRTLVATQNDHTGVVTDVHVMRTAWLESLFAQDRPPTATELSFVPSLRAVRAARYWHDVCPASPADPQPMTAVYVDGRYIVVAVAPELPRVLQQQLGSQVVAVDATPVDWFVGGLVSQQRLRYDPHYRKPFQPELALCQGSDPQTVKFHTRTGERIQTSVPCDGPGVPRPSMPGSWPEGWNIVTRILVPGKVAYLRLPIMIENHQAGKIASFLQRVAGYPALVVDVRGNQGGNDWVWSELLVRPLSEGDTLETQITLAWRQGGLAARYVPTALSVFEAGFIPGDVTAARPPVPFDGWQVTLTRQAPLDQDIAAVEQYPSIAPVGFNGRVYVLVDRGVYSSAESFVTMVKATHWATLIGTETGGDGIGTMPQLVVLPNSQLTVRFPSVMGLTADGNINELHHTSPDVRVDYNVEDLLALARGWNAWPDHDTILQKALEVALDNLED